MAITFTSSAAGASEDYLRYLHGGIRKTDRVRDSVLLDFALAPVDVDFVKLTRGSYITISSTTYPKWFTGYIVNEPELEFLGKSGGAAVFGYKYQATSDEYILSLKPLGVLPPFLNKTQGSIIKQLIERQAPGLFDTTGIEDGTLLAEYTVDPTKQFLDVVREFQDSSCYRFYCVDHKAYYKPQDDLDGAVEIDGSSQHFTPSRLDLRPSSTPVINDVTVLGNAEPQKYVTEYFMGTGLDASFPMASNVFGVDAATLLDEVFSGGSIDSNKWELTTAGKQYMSVSDNYLNCTGGSSSYGASIYSGSPIPLDGRIRFTHGEWDFISGNGIICGLWKNVPGSLADCVYGLRVNGTTINPVCNGTADATQSWTIDTSKRYVIRTLAFFCKTNRTSQTYSYVSSAGAVVDLTGNDPNDDYVVWETLITEIDPTDGSIVNWGWLVNNVQLASAVSHALYCPIASTDFHGTVSGITISVPVSATLQLADQPALKNLGFESWDSDSVPTDWTTFGTIEREMSLTDSVAALKLVVDSASVPYVQQAANTLITANTAYKVVCKARRNYGVHGGSIKLVLVGTGVAETGLTIANLDLKDDGWTTVTGALTSGISSIPSDLKFKVYVTGAPIPSYVVVDDIIIYSSWSQKIVGPNEIESIDGQSPVATITQANDSGQAQLVFFKDSLTQTSNIPPENQLVKLTYRSSGPAVGRAISRGSINTEAAKWNDSGVRSIVRTDATPKPRTSMECELAAAAIAAENSFTHYEGSYSVWSSYVSAHPQAGANLTLTNITDVGSTLIEEITEVSTTIESASPELFQHTLSFGKPDRLRRLLSRFDSIKGSIVKPQEAQNANPVDVDAVGLVFAPDVTRPELVGWDDSVLMIDAGQDLGTNGRFFEVRYTDEGWGADSGKNLITRSATRTFTVPRNIRGKTFYIRQANAGNLLKYSEDQTEGSVYTLSNCTSSKAQDYNPNGNLSNITTLVFGANGYVSSSASITSGGCFSFSVKGTFGKTLTASIGSETKVVNLTGSWQRFSVPITAFTGSVTVKLTSTSIQTVKTTWWSVESGTSVERVYTRTTDEVYGPVSRYSSLVRVSFPAVTALGASLVVIRTAVDTTLAGFTNYLVKVDSTAEMVEITLPKFSEATGYTITVIKVVGANTVRVKGQGTDTVGGNAYEDLVEIGDGITVGG